MIIYNNNYTGAFEKSERQLTQHYTKVNVQNKSHSNPIGSMTDKYLNSHSSHYRLDMTDQQREIALKNEADMLRYGKLTAVYYDDYMLKDEPPVDSQVETNKEKQFNIDAVNHQFADLLIENHISLNQDITFSINPYDYQLNIEGIEDEDLKTQLEKLLNSDKNSENLFYHIFTRYMDKQSISKDSYNKFQVYREVKNHTGYDLRTLENKNGKFITPEGNDINTVYKNSVQKKPYLSQKQKNDITIYYGSLISDVAQKGWQQIEDLKITMTYSQGKLVSR